MRKSIVDKILKHDLPLSLFFHKNTAVKSYVKKSKDKIPDEWKTINKKAYPRFTSFSLPRPNKPQGLLSKSLINRESVRDYSDEPISQNNLSTILNYSVGLKKNKKNIFENRFYPSAGARYPIETYIVVFNVFGLNQGIYHYHLSNKLEYMWKSKEFKKQVLGCFNQNWINTSSFLILLTSCFWRNEVKYGNRGYRYSMMEIGHIAQNMYLIASVLGLGCCSIGGYIDDNINNLLDLNNENEAVGLVISFGKKKGGV